jgi:hypothetical protein
MARGALVGACLAALGCGVSPQPEPPSIDLARIDFSNVEGVTGLRGSAGAVTPGGAALTTLDLDTTAPGSSVDVDFDGAFQIAVGGAQTDVYRLQAIAAALRSEPVDVTSVQGFMAGTGLVSAPGPLASCLLLDPALELGPIAAGTTAAVTLVNHCTGVVTVGSLTLRVASPAWSVEPMTVPFDVAAGGSASFSVAYTPSGAPVDDVVFIDVTAPTAGRRAISLKGR